MSKSYTLIISPAAQGDIYDIYRYISFELKAEIAAKSIYDRLITMIDSLVNMPERHPLVDWEPWKSLNVRKVPVDKFVIFYFVNKKESIVSILRVLYGGQNVEDLINHSKDN